MPQWLIIGISGITCGGKTTLAHNLRDYFQSQLDLQLWNTPYIVNDVQLVSQDDYFLPVDDLRHKWNDKLNAINFELLTALDMKQMLSDIAWTTKGRYLATENLERTDYLHGITMSNKLDQYTPQGHYFPHHHFNHHYTHRHGNAMHIIRINSQMAAQLCDNKINVLIIEGFMIFNQPELLSLCNMKFYFHLPYEKCFERRRKRTYDPPDTIGYFEICVWPHYEKNSAEFRNRKDIVFLNGEVTKEKIFKYTLHRIVAYFEGHSVGIPAPLKLLGIPNCHLAKPCAMEQH